MAATRTDTLVVELKPDERQMLTLLRQETRRNVDFIICRREGRIVKMEANVVHVEEFKAENLPGPGSKIPASPA